MFMWVYSISFLSSLFFLPNNYYFQLLFIVKENVLYLHEPHEFSVLFLRMLPTAASERQHAVAADGAGVSTTSVVGKGKQNELLELLL